jgi:uncharacterized membrane protein YagU involved in acid resistance
VSAATQALGITRMNIPYMLGTIFTPNRDRAKLYGFAVHVLFGWLFSLVYVLIFESLGKAGWWRGALIGLLHAAFVLTVVATLLPGIHPRMASEQHGPEAQNMLEPPGFFALNYGFRTPLAIILSHVVFGAILGAYYRLR